MISADLHNHTTYSIDSITSPRVLVEQLTIHAKIKVAAITDHNNIRGIEETQRLASTYKDVLIIPGVEISTTQGDLLILGTEVLPPEPWNVENLVDFAKDNDCLSIAAHPYREFGLGDFATNFGIDAIEVLNGASSAQANKLARKLARSAMIPGVAGSDSHRPSDLFSVHTKVDASLNVDDIITAIKKGKVSTVTNNRSIHF